ncbi:MAG: hypothetical protein M3094_05665, partial [Actinomycetia bacterium]|nr:hypothetical protein [Actinomycetes bacterium]
SLTEDLFSANVLVSMPGTVIEHNADKVLGDGTLVWKLPLSGSVDIFAKSTFGGSSNSWIIWVLLGVLLVGIIAAVTATIVSRKESQKAVAAAAASVPVDATPPPPPVVDAEELTLPVHELEEDASSATDTEPDETSDDVSDTAPSDDDGDQPETT